MAVSVWVLKSAEIQLFWCFHVLCRQWRRICIRNRCQQGISVGKTGPIIVLSSLLLSQCCVRLKDGQTFSDLLNAQTSSWTPLFLLSQQSPGHLQTLLDSSHKILVVCSGFVHLGASCQPPCHCSQWLQLPVQQQQHTLCQLALLLPPHPTHRMLQGPAFNKFQKLQQVLFCYKCAYKEVLVQTGFYTGYSLADVQKVVNLFFCIMWSSLTCTPAATHAKINQSGLSLNNMATGIISRQKLGFCIASQETFCRIVSCWTNGSH